MTLSAKGQFTGLMTATSELNAPPGALRRADNVVIRKPGAIETRQGTDLLEPSFGLFVSRLFTNAIEHAGTVVWETSSGWYSSAGTLKQYTPYRFGSAVTPAKMRLDSFSVAFARGNMYYPHSRGVLRASAASEAEWNGSGMTAGAALLTYIAAGTGTMLPTGWQVAYRVVGIRTDANGLIVRSRPSGAVSYRNTSGITLDLTVGASVGFGIEGSDATSVEIYRSRAFPNTVAVDDEMMLVATLPVKIDNTVDPFADRVPDSQRGVALYTSPSRGGIENANDAPPACAFLETYRGHLFFGNIAGPQRKVVSYTSGTGLGATGVGNRVVTATCVSGSPVLTSVTPVSGLQVGQLMDGAWGVFQATILSIVGSTVTTDTNATISSVGGPYNVYDTIELSGRWHQVSAGATQEYIGQVSRFGVYSVYNITPPITGKEHTIVIQDNNPGGGAFTIRATHGDEYEPPLPLAGATAATSEGDVYPNGLIYSEPDQPEHVPPRNFMLIGEKSKAILGLAATRDSLFIFKEDGIWRLSGINGNWRVDPFDMTTFCVLPSSIKKMDNRIYLLSNKGVVRVSEQGTELLSAPIADVVAKLVDDCIANEQTLGYYKLTGLDGQAAIVDGRNNEYRLLVGDNELRCGGQELVYNARTNAWTTFSYRGYDDGFAYLDVVPTGLGSGLQNVPLVLHMGGAREPIYERSTYSSPEPYEYASDGDLAKTVTLVTPDLPEHLLTFINVSASPATGDLMVDSSGSAYVVTNVGGNIARVLPTNPASVPIPGVFQTFRALECTVQPHGFSSPLFAAKFWGSIYVAVSRFRGVFKASIDYTSAEPLTTEIEQSVEESFVMPTGSNLWPYFQGSLMRQLVPRAHARAWLLRPTLKWSVAFGEVVLESIAAEQRESLPRTQQNSSSEG